MKMETSSPLSDPADTSRAPRERGFTLAGFVSRPWFFHWRPLVLFWSAAVPAVAATILDDVDPRLYRDEAALYPSVGRVTGAIFGGSGVLVSDRWVLTAGHVALGKTGGTFTIGGTAYQIQASITYPDYAFPNNFSDIGLLYLSSPVLGVTPATMLGLDTSTQLLGLEATWVGFGIGGTGTSGAQGGFDHRAFTNVIDVFGPAYGLTSTAFISDFDKPDGSTNASGSSPEATRLEGNVASGDSGGGVFVTIDGETRLVGITSFTGGFAPGTNSRYGSISGATDLNQFHAWITDQTGIVPVPEPSIPVFAALALLGFALRRNRGGGLHPPGP